MLQIPVRDNNLAAGCLVLRSNRVIRAVRTVPELVSVSPRHSARGADTAEFIKATYRDIYSAYIEVSYPLLMSVSEPGGGILAAIGFRYAGPEQLFLEQYTHRPIETILECERSRVVEIGNLASVGGGVSMYLFLALASYLNKRGIDHAVATGTKNLEKRLRRIGLQPRVLCAADPASLESAGDDWGTYYDTGPMVLAGRVDLGLACLQKALSAEYTDTCAQTITRFEQEADLLV